MNWQKILLFVILICAGVLLQSLFTISQCERCNKIKIREKTLKCLKCERDNLRIVPRYQINKANDYVVVCYDCGEIYELPNISKTKENKNED